MSLPDKGSQPTTHQMFRARYLSGDVPWEAAEPPPEIVQLTTTLEPGRALDLGCGHGRTSLHLARNGWEVDALDFVSEAVGEARSRTSAAGLLHQVGYCVADVTELPFAPCGYDLAVDIGCSHRLPKPGLSRLNRGLKRLMRDGALYVMFAKLRTNSVSDGGDRKWLDESMLLEVFADGFELDRLEHGVTGRQDGSSVPSSWYWFRRTATGRLAQ